MGITGSYLSEPVTDKVSSDEASDKLNCGASSMQGWRVTQEDAHNCLLEFDKNTAFFAVYDGHGGHEVAQYCAQKLPDFIKDSQPYKEGNVEKALIEGFLGFDATIASREVVAVLKEIAGDKEAEEESDDENLDNLYEEAAMPIEKVIEKYTKQENVADAKSPFLLGKKSLIASSSSACSSSSSSKKEKADSSSADGVSSSCTESNEAESGKAESNGPTIPAISSSTSVSNSNKNEAEVKVSTGLVNEAEVKQNGSAIPSTTSEAEPKDDVTSSQENGEVLVKKAKGGKALTKTKGVVVSPAKEQRPKRDASYRNLLVDFEEQSSEDDEEDTSVNLEAGVTSDDSEEAGSSGEECEEEDDEEEEEDLIEEDDEDLEFTRNMREEPGSDSGCTAVVALLKDNKLFVANAGDSRCVVCRNGKAVEMSFDHKPEDEPEQQRVVKAGGRVTAEGRVNGGLNLSRAIGDHAYKQNKELSEREQMIIALPDVKILDIGEEDEFMVLACDGIWNFMSSQEVVDFVRPRIKENQNKLSHICEEMFDHCLAPNAMGDGTGCDNMTAIIVTFNRKTGKKRPLSETAESDSSEDTTKKAKTEDNAADEATIDTTA